MEKCIKPNAFGNALGSSLAEKSSGVENGNTRPNVVDASQYSTWLDEQLGAVFADTNAKLKENLASGMAQIDDDIFLMSSRRIPLTQAQADAVDQNTSKEIAAGLKTRLSQQLARKQRGLLSNVSKTMMQGVEDALSPLHGRGFMEATYKAPDLNSLIRDSVHDSIFGYHEETVPYTSPDGIVAGETTIRVANRPAASIGYANEMKNAFWATGQMGVGFGRGLVNGVPVLVKTIGDGYSQLFALGVDGTRALFGATDSDYLGKTIDFTQKWDGRVLSYSNDFQKMGGYGGELFSPNAYGKVLTAGSELYSAVKIATNAANDWNVGMAEARTFETMTQRASAVDIVSGPLKVTTEQANQLRALAGAEFDSLIALKQAKGITNNQMGPALSVAMDLETGYVSKVYRNNQQGFMPDNMSSQLVDRLNIAPNNVLAYERTHGIGSHAEIYAVDELFKVRPNANFSDFAVHTIELQSSKFLGSYKPACPHCNFLLSDVQYVK